MDAKSISLSFANHLEYSLSKDKYTATMRDVYLSLALAARDRMVERWIRTQQMYYDYDVKRVYYLSAEYLPGRLLTNNLINMGIYKETDKTMEDLNMNLDAVAEQEPDPGLGNGGLGRLAACYMDSLATLEIPAYGYGIRYEFGIFDQEIRNLQQVERPEHWLKFGNPWEIPRPEYNFTVKFYGWVKESVTPQGKLKTELMDTRDVIGVAYDIPIPGYGNETVNTLRLWSARASKEFDLKYFQHGDYLKAVEEKNVSENISKVLYPNDEILAGQELRLKQQYFFVSCSVQDIVRRYLVNHKDFSCFPDKIAIQMNDTHPSLAVVELMRILLDEHGLSWEDAWDITVNSCAYTNHTLLSEALEKWPVDLFERVLPRQLKIIYEINRRFLRDVNVMYLGDNERLERMSIVEERPKKQVNMAHLAVLGSHSVNGVARLHTRLVKENVFADFVEMFPQKFNNKTNGITPRRWLLAANPGLSELINEKVGKDWPKKLNKLVELEKYVEDEDFRRRFREIKYQNKQKLAEETYALTGVHVDPSSIFDVQVKRIHQYKRQILNVLHVISCWLRLKRDPGYHMHPRTFFFGGKAAPSYHMAKLTVRLICHVAQMVNGDAGANSRLKVVFLPNYRVSLAEKIFPASDISEQISTAGFEASGTGNMKFALNGALTVGTLDGANIEIKDEVGEENIFIFGLKAEEVEALRPRYNPRDYYEASNLLKKAVDLVYEGFFSPEQPGLFRPLMDELLNSDNYMIMADFDAYVQCQEQVGEAYADREEWTRKAIINVARMGKFSSDRAVTEYNRDIWLAPPLKITREDRPTPGREVASKI